VQPVYDEDAEFIDHKEDLVTLRPGREHAWLDASVEKVLQCCNCPVIEVSISNYWPYKFAERCQYLFRSKVGLAYSTAADRDDTKICYRRRRRRLMDPGKKSTSRVSELKGL
jgi:hypothetical protein